MKKYIHRIFTVILVITLLICCIPSVFAAANLTYEQYLQLSVDEQIAYRNSFASSAAFKAWYAAAKKAHEDAQQKITIGDQTVNLGDIINPPLASGSCGTALTWKLNKDYVLTISGTGVMDNYTAGTAPWADYADSIQKIILSEGVSTIGSSAFASCGATYVKIPTTVTEIGESAFADCSVLSTVVYSGRASSTSSVAGWNGVTVNSGNEVLLAADIAYAGEVRISAATLSLEHNIAVRYKVKKATVETYGFSGLYLIVNFNGVTKTLTEYTEEGDSYVFHFRNIAPNQMNDIMVATLYATRDGAKYVSKSTSYSIAEYCENQLARYSADDYATFRTLLVDLLNYGAAAQKYTHYREDALVNKNLTTTQASWATANKREYNNVQTTKYAVIDNPTVTWRGGGLILNDSVTMRFKFEASDTTGLSFRITSGDKTWIVTNFIAEGSTNYIYFNNLNAGQMSQDVFITAYQNGVAVSNTVRYSIESYASAKENDNDITLAELVVAMMKYGDSAYKFAN